MTSISTQTMQSQVLLGITTAQSQLQKATTETSSGKLASDLSGYAQSDEQITAARSLISRNQGYIDANTNLSNKLDLQNTVLTQVGTASTTALQAVQNAIATGSGVNLMTSLQSAFSSSISALNQQYSGSYLFGGTNTNTPPLAISQLSDLTTPAATASIASVFQNDQNAPTARLDDATVVTTGQLASSIATPLYQALQTVQAYVNANGSFSNPLTSAQSSFLDGIVSSFQTAQSGITDATSQNGQIQNQVQTVTTNLTDQNTSLTAMLSNLTDADMATVATNLSQAQFALQASARVFTTLQNSSLITLLPIA